MNAKIHSKGKTVLRLLLNIEVKMSDNIPNWPQNYTEGYYNGSNNEFQALPQTNAQNYSGLYYSNNQSNQQGFGSSSSQYPQQGSWNANNEVNHYLIHDNTPNFYYGSDYGTMGTTNQFNPSYQYQQQQQQFPYYPCSSTFPSTMNGQQQSQSGPKYNNYGENMGQQQMPTVSNQFFPTPTPPSNYGNRQFSTPPVYPIPIQNKATPSKQPAAKKRAIYDEDFSEKLISFARYNRNNTLIKEILSDVIIPKSDVVSSTRLNKLKEQVRLLENHYKEVDVELKMVEKTCTERRRKFMESTTSFNEKYNKLCRPAVGFKNYSEMFLKSYNLLKTETEEKKQQLFLQDEAKTLASDQDQESCFSNQMM